MAIYKYKKELKATFLTVGINSWPGIKEAKIKNHKPLKTD